MSKILAIDPGPAWSAWVFLDVETCAPIEVAKEPNGHVLARLHDLSTSVQQVAVEMVASYGMAVGADVFDTVVWIGRYVEAARACDPRLITRRDVKLHHCGNPSANDANITQALRDRFAPGQPNYGKGTKAAPGWFHGFSEDIWQAYALGVLAADQARGRLGVAATSTGPAGVAP